MREQLPPLMADFVVTRTVVAVPTTVVPLLTQDPNRWAIIFGNVQVSPQIVVDIKSDIDTTRGFNLNQTVNPWVLTFRDVGALVGEPWYAVSPSGTGQLTVITVQYRPVGGG